MLLRFVDDTFTDSFITSIGAEGDFKKQEIKVGAPHNTTVTLEIVCRRSNSFLHSLTSDFSGILEGKNVSELLLAVFTRYLPPFELLHSQFFQGCEWSYYYV